MDDLVVLRWFMVLIAVAVACAITIFSPFLVTAIALSLLTAGVIVRISAGQKNGSNAVGTTLVTYGIAILLPPMAYFISALRNMPSR